VTSLYGIVIGDKPMATERKNIPFRPDYKEVVLLAKLAEKRGLSASRLLGTALREMAERENVTVTDAEAEQARAEHEDRKEKPK
jgi:hypothetical protein